MQYFPSCWYWDDNLKPACFSISGEFPIDSGASFLGWEWEFAAFDKELFCRALRLEWDSVRKSRNIWECVEKTRLTVPLVELIELHRIYMSLCMHKLKYSHFQFLNSNSFMKLIIPSENVTGNFFYNFTNLIFFKLWY